jgi:hypothetical protein
MGKLAKLLWHLVPAFVASFAFMTSFIGNFWCESILFEPDTSAVSTNDNMTTTTVMNETLYFGPWYRRETVLQRIPGSGGRERYQVKQVCTAYSGDVNIDAKWKTVRAFSIMAPLLGGLLTIVLYVSPCFMRLNEAMWKSIAHLFMIVITLFQGLTFLWLREGSACDPNTPLYGSRSGALDLALSTFYPNECKWGPASTANVFSTSLWFLMGIAMYVIGVPK